MHIISLIYKRFVICIFITFLFCSLSDHNLGYGVESQKGSSLLTVYIVDVGQGDAIFIDIFGKKTVLIDAGPPRQFKHFFYIKKQGIHYFINKHHIKKVDQFIISHANQDHIGGLKIILKKMKVNGILDPGFAYPSKLYETCLELIEKKKIKYQIVRKGMKYNIYNVHFEILSPRKLIRSTKNDVNSNSIVLKMTYKNISFLFTGDIEHEIEQSLLPLKSKLHSTFLKSPHHGSETSNTLEFIRLVQPKAVFISCGRKNIFGHPSQSVLKRYNKLNIPVYRTDLLGTIAIKTDGYTYTILSNKVQDKKDSLKMSVPSNETIK